MKDSIQQQPSGSPAGVGGKLDILAIGVHPDDVELGCSGTLINEIKRGKKIGIVDLTQGELSTRGTVETRYKEAASAAMTIGATIRENLKMRDGFFRNDEEHQLKLIRTIRKYQPDIIIGNVLSDRHPDHGRAGHLISDASYLSGLAKIETKDEAGRGQLKWRPRYFLQYLQDWYHEPDFLIDISEVFEQRMKSIEAYASQFHSGQSAEDSLQTYISTPDFLESIVARARLFGKRIGVKYAEGFMTEKKIGLKNLDSLIQIET
jgi:bacillithiol biosynthesis deacetylase BshB1